MDCRNFELTLVSARDLEDVRKLCKMKVYAKVTIGSNPDTEKRTHVDKHGQIDPAWNFMIKYTVGESVLKHHGVMLVIKLYCKRKLGDRYIGEVHMSMKELFDYSLPYGGSAVVNYPVKRGSLPSQGMLHFSYRFGNCVNVGKVLLAEGIGEWAKCIV